MGRPPTHGAPSFRFFPAEVAQMETLLQEHDGHVPSREILLALADKFSNTPERSGKITVQMKQVWNWFQNRRYALRSKLVKPPGKLNVPPNTQGEVTPVKNVPPAPQQTLVPPGLNVVKNTSESTLMEFEAKSARDGAWYDVQAFHAHRYFETGNPEVLVRFSGFGPEEDEWVNVRKHVRQRSLPCESSECVAVLPGDLILCFQEGKEQALYFDAHVLDAQRRRHDMRGCRCRFLVRYDHDQSEEIVPLRKVCRRPETDYRLQMLHAANESASTSVSADSKRPIADSTSNSALRVTNSNLSAFPTVTASTSINAGTGVSHLAVTATPISTVAPAPALPTTSGPALASTSVLVPAPALPPALASTSVSAPVLSTAPALALTSISAPAPALASTSIPAPAQAPLSSTPIPAPVPVPAFASASVALSPVLASASVPAPAPALVSALASDPAPTSALVSDPAPSSSTIPISAPTPSPTLNVAPVSVPDPILAPAAQALAPTRAPILLTVRAAAPELQKIEDDNPGTSVGEASAPECIVNPGAAIVKVKEEEGSNPEGFMLSESSISQGETSDNPSTLVPEPVKVGDCVPSEPTMAVCTATTDGGLTELAKAESGNLAVSTEDTKA